MKPIGAITQYIDVAQVMLYLFWIFFGSLVIYLNRESKREGYPLDSGNPNDPDIGLVSMPAPKTSSCRTVIRLCSLTRRATTVDRLPRGRWLAGRAHL